MTPPPPPRSAAIIEFIEMLKIPSGADQGKPFRLRDWQKEIIRGVYDPVDERGKRRVRRVLITMARKNAKTTLIAALVLVHLIGPEARERQQIFSAANDREQAAEVYQAAAAMVEMDEDLSRLVRPIASRKRLVCHALGSFYVALSADAKTKHGKNPALWIYDELAQAPKTDLYDALDTSQGAQDEPLGIVISTQAIDPRSLMSQLVDDAKRVLAARAANDNENDDPTLAAFIFEVPKDADPFDESLWKLANPALGDFCSLAELRAAAAKAKRLPSRLNVFRNLNLNQQVDALTQFIPSTVWLENNAPVDREALRGRKCWGGLDLSMRCDLTALVLVFEADENGKHPVLPFIWTPAKNLNERSLQDTGAAMRFMQWRDAGHLLVVPGSTVNYDFVAHVLAELAEEFDIQGIAYDRFRIGDMKTSLEKTGLQFCIPTGRHKTEEQYGLKLIEFGQGWGPDMPPAVDQIEEDLLEARLAHGAHPVLTWNAGNAIASADPAGNRKLDKAKARNRIDAFVALTMANMLRVRAGTAEGPGRSIYDEIAEAEAAKANQAA